eukprot:TRINITY_DN11993_c0_g1_i1.p2 TRINITY_DN11993_c0_g1~~TRINITY_DN11993_c0_g1_i1.p2  ORF type:complete len:154 (+),score=33.00 TRINITY_DN11993_c0_g1_i1:330-791(+)
MDEEYEEGVLQCLLRGDLSQLDQWVEMGFGRRALMLSISHELFFCIENILENYPALALEQNSLGESAIHIACRFGNDQVLRLILPYSTLVLNAPAYQLCTPLHYAAQREHLGQCKLLIDAGCDINCRDVNGEYVRAIHSLEGKKTKKTCLSRQ